MLLSPIFNFKGAILPVADRNNKLYFFIKNDCDHKILLNFVNARLNVFIYVDAKSTKLINFGLYNKNNQVKTFYMGHEIFNFNTNEIDKSALLHFSNYILKTNNEINKISFSLSFLSGCTIQPFSTMPQTFYLKLINKDTNAIIHENTFSANNPYVFYNDSFINYNILIYNNNNKLVYNYNLNLNNKKIWIKFETHALGDTLAWMPYVEEFRKKHNCEIFCTTHWNDLFIKSYPNITFISTDAIVDNSQLFAIYKIKCGTNYHSLNIQEIAAKSLGMPYKEIKPFIAVDNDMPIIDGEYVVISTASTAKAKLWNCKGGWQKIIDYLNKKNLKVVLLQKEKDTKLKNIINLSCTENIYNSINIIKNCKFFIGLSSGLSWLAWALNKKVIMISGFTNPNTEFKENNYRIINEKVCNSCWNDNAYQFDAKNWFWCPRNKNFECTSSIKPTAIIKSINNLLNDI